MGGFMYKFKDFKKHPYIIPIYCVIAAELIFIAVCGIRTAIKNPDISFKRPYNEPYESHRDQMYKAYMSPGEKASWHPSFAPKFKDEPDESQKK